MVGEGSFGKVFQIYRKGTSQIYAIKVINKDVLLHNFDDAEVKAYILTKIMHPFIVQIRYLCEVLFHVL